MKPEAQLAELKRGVVDLHVEADLLERLSEGRPLKVKAGFDPTRPDLHLGHTVLLNKMRQFQDLGHEVIFIVGDFTAQIGDPSGRSSTRPVPTRDEIEEGARTYAQQAFKILDKNRTKIVYNGEWLGKMAFDDVIRLAGKYTLARMMERDDFKRRWAEHASISLHELLYPLAQAYDSVVLECDVELGGTDQLFNLLVGREIMREMGQRPQIVMTTPILEGINARADNGVIVGAKMSKSLDNYVGVDEAPKEQFGKLMSVSDDLMWRYYELLSTEPTSVVTERKKACVGGSLNPRDAKIALGKEIVTRYHGAEAATAAETSWLAQFSKRQVPDDMPTHVVELDEESVWIPKLLSDLGLVKSSSDGRRRIQQGGVEIDGERVSDPQAKLPKGGPYVVKAGKRAWAEVTLK
ncbi:MAG: tyrosine--tRNA ligase [Myxococcota bacterium]